MSRRIEVYSECSLSEFDDEDILNEAREIIERHRRTSKPKGGSEPQHWQNTEEAMQKLAHALGVEIQDERLLPASTAAKIKSMEELRALMAGDGGQSA